MLPRVAGRHSTSRRAHQIALLNEIGFEDVLDGTALLADGGGEIVSNNGTSGYLAEAVCDINIARYQRINRPGNLIADLSGRSAFLQLTWKIGGAGL